MIEPPSTHLLQALFQHRLCSRRDLRRCRRVVKKLTRDLPAFDSAWIDALLQSRRITPFQARLLESGRADELSIGPCLLVDRLGSSHAAETYLARHRETGERCVLKIVERPTQTPEAAFHALERLVEQTAAQAEAGYVAPHACLWHAERVVILSRYVAGLHLGEMLIRRGRFPAAVVWEAARQMTDALAALEQKSILHGDIQLRNVRLTSAGRLVLLDAGIRPAVSPELTIHARLSPERCDGAAPELLGTGQHPSIASDCYALGCLLWHLLAGRPPYTAGDPLSRLAAHQSGSIPDVRELAPDTPPLLAEAIRSLTERDPAKRPQSFQSLRQQWGTPRRSSWRRIARFRASFEAQPARMPVATSGAGSGNWTLVLVSLFVLTGATLTLVDTGNVSLPLNIGKLENFRDAAARLIGQGIARSDVATVDLDAEESLLPLPAPDADGVIHLKTPGPYRADRLNAVGPLAIRGAQGIEPTVVVSGQACSVVAGDLTVENVHFRIAANVKEHPHVLLDVHAQNLIVRKCSFDAQSSQPSNRAGNEDIPAWARDDAHATSPGGQPNSVRATAIRWKAVDPQDQSGRLISIRNSVFRGEAGAIQLAGGALKLELENCLKLGPGALVSLAAGGAEGRSPVIALNHVALRDASSLLEIGLSSAGGSGSDEKISVEADDCVFDLTGAHPAVCRITASAQQLQAAGPKVDVIGEGSLVQGGGKVAVAVWHNPDDGSMQQYESESIVVEGIFAVAFEWSGPASAKPADSVVKAFQVDRVPRRSLVPPGIDATVLPAPNVGDRTDP